MTVTLTDIHTAAANVARYTIRTPQRKSPQLSARLGVNVELKLEMGQHSGSFKTRGAFHQMLALGDAVLRQGCGGRQRRQFRARGRLLQRRSRRRRDRLHAGERAPGINRRHPRLWRNAVELLPDAVAAFARADEWVAQGRSLAPPL